MSKWNSHYSMTEVGGGQKISRFAWRHSWMTPKWEPLISTGGEWGVPDCIFRIWCFSGFGLWGLYLSKKQKIFPFWFFTPPVPHWKAISVDVHNDSSWKNDPTSPIAQFAILYPSMDNSGRGLDNFWPPIQKLSRMKSFCDDARAQISIGR